MGAIHNYKTALRRLTENKPENVPKGSAINKDTVALEAGRGRGSIKKCRPEFADLIKEIEDAAEAQKAKKISNPKAEAERLKGRTDSLKKKLEALKKEHELALQKIVSLVYQNHQLKNVIKEMGGGTVCFSEVTSIGIEQNRPVPFKGKCD